MRYSDTGTEIDRLLASDSSLSALKPHIPRFPDRLQAHAKFMSNSYTGEHLPDHCDCCLRLPMREAVELRWEAQYHDGWTAIPALITVATFHGDPSGNIVPFFTRHRLCTRCHRRIALRRIIARQLDRVLGVCFFFTLAAMLIPIMLLIVEIPNPRVDPRVWFIGAIGGFLALAIGILWAERALQRWIVPKPLRRIAKHPFVLREVLASRPPEKPLTTP